MCSYGGERAALLDRRGGSFCVPLKEIEYLKQEGYLALYDAVDGYNLELGYKFLTLKELENISSYRIMEIKGA